MSKLKIGDKVRCIREAKDFDGVLNEEYEVKALGGVSGIAIHEGGYQGNDVSRFVLVENITIDNRGAISQIVTLTPQSTGKKLDDGKNPLELLSVIAMEGTAKVLQFGARKYSPNNWRGGIAWGRLIGACLRHLFAFMRGEDLDKETGLPHLDHLACEIMFLQEFYRTRKDLDDRYKITLDESSNVTQDGNKNMKGTG